MEGTELNGAADELRRILEADAGRTAQEILSEGEEWPSVLVQLAGHEVELTIAPIQLP